MPLIAKSPYDNVLTGIGLIQNGAISSGGEQAFINDVMNLLTIGNKQGATLQPIASLFPFPPISGPTILGDSLFWFGPDPVEANLASSLLDKNKTSFWHSIFIDILYQQTANLLDLAGNTPLFPIFDPSAPFGVELPFPFTVPQLAAKLSVPPINLIPKLIKANIKLSLPIITPPTITIPSPITVKFDSNGLPISTVVIPAPPNAILPKLLEHLVLLPFDVLTNVLVPPNTSLVYDLPGLPKKIASLIFDAFLSVLSTIGFSNNTLPRTFIASIIVYLKNVIAMLCVIIVANILGTGAIALGVGELLGLVSA